MQPSDDFASSIISNQSPIRSSTTPAPSYKNQMNPNNYPDDLYIEESISSEYHQPRSIAFANVHVKIEDVSPLKPNQF